MAKLSETERIRARKLLQKRVETAIKKAEGLNKWEVLHHIVEAIQATGILEV